MTDKMSRRDFLARTAPLLPLSALPIAAADTPGALVSDDLWSIGNRPYRLRCTPSGPGTGVFEMTRVEPDELPELPQPDDCRPVDVEVKRLSDGTASL